MKSNQTFRLSGQQCVQRMESVLCLRPLQQHQQARASVLSAPHRTAGSKANAHGLIATTGRDRVRSVHSAEESAPVTVGGDQP